MIDQSMKPSPSLLPRKKELQNLRSTRLVSNIGSRLNKSKPEWMTNKKISDNSIPPQSREKNIEKQCEHQRKSKICEPTRTKQETSEGVHEFIKQVSDFIKKKNFDKETPKNDGSATIASIQFNGTGRKPQQKRCSERVKPDEKREILPSEKVKNHGEHSKLRQKLYSLEYLKKDSETAKEKQIKSINSARDRDQNEKFSQSEIKKTESRTIEKPSDECFAVNESEETNSECSRKALEESFPKEVHRPIKKRRKSEIPLRKNRTYSSKPISWLQRKPSFSEMQSSISIDFCPNSEPLSPVQELSLCSYIEMKFNVNSDFDNLSTSGSLMNYEINQNSNSESNPISTKLSKRCLTAVSPVTSDSFSVSLTEKPSTAGREILSDVEKVTASSFTILRTDSAVLQRLESFHKQNINSKVTKVPLKTKTLVPDSAFHLLVRKPSKRGLSSRLSSKERRTGQKTKGRKHQGLDSEEPKKLRKCCEEKLKVLGLQKHGGSLLKSRKCEFIKNDDSQMHRRVTSSKAKLSLSQPKDHDRIMTAKVKPPKDEEKFEVKTNQPIRSSIEAEKENLKKATPEKNRRNIDIGDSLLNDDCHTKKLDILMDESILRATPVNISAKKDDRKFAREEDEDDDGWSSKTIIFNGKFSNENISAVDFDRKNQNSDSFIKSSPPALGQDEPPEKPEADESPTTGKKLLKIDLSLLELGNTEDETENFSFELDFPKIEKEVVCQNETGSGNTNEKERRTGRDVSVDLLSSEVTEEPGPLNAVFKTPWKNCSSLKRKTQYKPAIKTVKKKKIRSDGGDRLLRTPSSNSVSNLDKSLPNVTNTDAYKLRNSLTNSLVREEKRDVFEDVAAIKLRRRNSEPLSFRGYIWKCADFPRGHKASVSSMASSLRHLNTDEMDDFILWEAVPQKMTSCWEMSLYHSKRPWSVLSCSVFKDNRKSSTPGLILENLRNEGVNTRRSAINQNERTNNRKENPFDVEPSIAQKNIDIRNWLAALNFPTLPSTSNDVFSEGNFPPQSIVDPQNMNKNQANPKRRKVMPNLKFSEETTEKKYQDKEKFKKTTKWREGEGEGLTELIRKKSGGFVTKEQYLNSEHSLRRPNVTVNLCVYSKSAEEASVVVETSEKFSPFEPRKYKSVEVASQPELSISATIVGAVGPDDEGGNEKCRKEKGRMTVKKEDDKFVLTFRHLMTFLNQELSHFVTDCNIWKFLFIFTLFVAIAHYLFLKSYTCYN